MRRPAAIAVVTAAALAVTAAIAWAAPAAITGTGLDTFDASTYNHDGGTVATLTVTGGHFHNVTSVAASNEPGSVGGKLFASATISSGSTAVNGTQYLPAGDYAFFCTVHGAAQMSGTLHVTGTPLPRPAAGGGPGAGGAGGSQKKKCKKGRRLRHGKCVRKHRHR